ncbi:uncharacterized protein PgNI_04193 [Pyricularia grisea]|uniref:Uncharacterized protein n=1 Tax=Pyricularia grisea TaxID=148305 RepID=A0A6P8BEQ7_PYRGI|nr:uncharacterized protein PgNI_04193 [Pyricularia grisea]TLD14323.1 hypothetical protein PgNI_04193 [Pyricularia grisea]
MVSKSARTGTCYPHRSYPHPIHILILAPHHPFGA